MVVGKGGKNDVAVTDKNHGLDRRAAELSRVVFRFYRRPTLIQPVPRHSNVYGLQI